MAKKILNLNTENGEQSWEDGSGGETVNIETLTADKTLTASDATVQIYTSTANRVVNLPTTGLTLGQRFEIWNNNAYNAMVYLEIKQSTTTLYYVSAQTKIELRWDGTNWVTEWKYNISIGREAYNNYTYGIGIGNNVHNNNTYGVGIGNGANFNYNYGIGIGDGANNNYTFGVGIGCGAKNNYSYGVGIGDGAYYNYAHGIGIGNGASSNSNYGIGIGRNASGNRNYSIGLGAFAGNGQGRANTLYIHSSSSTVGANALIYGEFDNRIVRINNTLYVNDLVGTGDRPVVADSNGKLKVGTSTLPSRTEYLSENLSGTEHIFTGTALGITGDLRSRIKNIKCFAVDSSNDLNGALIANEFIYENDVTVNTTTDLSGSFKIKLFIEYV